MRRVVLGAAAGVGLCSLAVGLAVHSAPVAASCSRHYVDQHFRAAGLVADRLARQFKKGAPAPGLQVAVAVRGRVVYSDASGVRELATSAPVCASTIFRIGSISKSLTAAALGQLVEQGRINLDAPIQRYLPNYPKTRWPITTRELAGHLSGIRHLTPGEDLSDRHYGDVLDTFRIFEHDPLLFQSGTQFHYSSYGFDVIGGEIEKVSGAPYADYMKSHVFAPAQMTETQPDWLSSKTKAHFYELGGDARPHPAPPVDLSNTLPAGGFDSTATDLVRFGSALLTNKLLTPQTLKLLFTMQHTSSGQPTGYGIGFEIYPRPLFFAGHQGSAMGSGGLLIMQPQSGVVVAILGNIGAVTTPDGVGFKNLPPPPTFAMPFIRAAPPLADPHQLFGRALHVTNGETADS